ncbi:hypothetical protein CDL12_29054 [Handroanthus impetiginosus]|uniref:COX assembly mitochondrial protein n=1 Tax=Handroanthus impetiginosus TaxID=429701 RepID=A0A2G9FZI6_9LAMI|nr:hypothetical protein CDL12_29054 [Handroanthus impetiginosus]
MHPPLTIHRHRMCAEIIEQFQKCHLDHPVGKFFGECTDLKIKLDKCFCQEKAVKRKANFEESKKLKERLEKTRILHKLNVEVRYQHRESYLVHSSVLGCTAKEGQGKVKGIAFPKPVWLYHKS